MVKVLTVLKKRMKGRKKRFLKTAAAVLLLSLVLGGCSYHVSSLDGSGGDTGAAEETYPQRDTGEDGGDEGRASGSGRAESGDGLSDGGNTEESTESGNSLSDDGGTEKRNSRESESGSAGSDGTGSGSSRESESDNSESGSSQSSGSAGDAMQGPDTPPDGERYDEWKGFEYTDATTFSTRGYWAIHMSGGGLPSDYGIEQDPDYIDGTLTITDVKAEPVGGEMKLRSGGYVDVTVEAEWTGTITMRADPENLYSWDTFVWQSVSLAPCDAYTGTSLLNYSDLDDERASDNALYVGEGSNSGLVESDVTWKDRIYRLYAAMDSRNASFGDSSLTYEGGKEVYSQSVKELETLTLRVPADYDGLVLAIEKDITGEKSLSLDERGNILNTKDRYADILTDNSGKKHSADEFYFVKLSKLIEMF